MRVFYSPKYTIPLPQGHRFPMQKYRLLYERLISERVLSEEEIEAPRMATREELLLAHTAEYIDSVLDGSLDRQRVRRIGFPWSEGLVARSRATVGGAIGAAEAALRDGIAGNLAGGTHHAMADAGEGYCVFNDMAVAALHLIREGKIQRAAIVDLDVHQGNGNSQILGHRDDVFVFSMHGERNFPFRKVPSSLDIGLPDGAGDESYLALLRGALPTVFAFLPDLVFYQAGVDPLKEDRLGKLALTLEGLRERDLIVLSECYRRGIPVVLGLGGGYAQPIALTVQAHVGTYRIAKQVFEGIF